MSSAASELLPDPATPVTHVSTPFGIRTVRLRRLLVVADVVGGMADGAFLDARFECPAK